MPMVLGYTIKVVKNGKETKCACEARDLCPGISSVTGESGLLEYKPGESCHHGKHIAEGSLTPGHIIECAGGKFFYVGRTLKENSEEHFFMLLQRNND